VGNVRAVLTSAAGAAPIELTLVDDGLNHFHADFKIGAPGDWDVTIEGEVQGGAALSYRTTMTVGE